MIYRLHRIHSIVWKTEIIIYFAILTIVILSFRFIRGLLHSTLVCRVLPWFLVHFFSPIPLSTFLISLAIVFISEVRLEPYFRGVNSIHGQDAEMRTVSRRVLHKMCITRRSHRNFVMFGSYISDALMGEQNDIEVSILRLLLQVVYKNWTGEVANE